MKTTKLECVTPEAVRAHLKRMAEELNVTSKSGSSTGGASRLAVKMGDTVSSISATIRGSQAPSKKVLAYLGLERADLYVKTSKSQGK